MLNGKELQDALKCAHGEKNCGDCCSDENGNCFEEAVETALEYRKRLKLLVHALNTMTTGGKPAKFSTDVMFRKNEAEALLKEE